MRKNILLLVMLSIFLSAEAQHTIYKENGYLEFSGYVTTYYNYRFYPSGTTSLTKNRFNLDYLVTRFSGMSKKVWYYTIQLNSAALLDPQSNDGFVMEASASYKSLKDKLSIEFGYDKLPFSTFSMVPNTQSPFLQRPELARGGVFSRRDVGVTVNYSLYNKQVELYGGAYTGLGATSLEGSNDDSGMLEYLARIEVSWPARYRELQLDLSRVNIPVFAAGIGGRYAQKKLTSGIDYPVMTIDGEKYSYSADARMAYRGFSAQVEAVQMRLQPRDSLLLYGKPTDYFLVGGFISQINFYYKKINSVFAVRYDILNPNDLLPADNEATLSFAYNYLFDGPRSCLKVHYMKRLKDSKAKEIWTDNQLRIAFQLMF